MKTARIQYLLFITAVIEMRVKVRCKEQLFSNPGKMLLRIPVQQFPPKNACNVYSKIFT